MRDRTQAFCLLDVNYGALEYATMEGSSPCELFPLAFYGRIAGATEKLGFIWNRGPATATKYSASSAVRWNRATSTLQLCRHISASWAAFMSRSETWLTVNQW